MRSLLKLWSTKGFLVNGSLGLEISLSSGTPSVLLNCVLGKVFHCKRGVRQGDPLSPILFILATDLLQSIVNKAKERGLSYVYLTLVLLC
jgi:hypothetical protein